MRTRQEIEETEFNKTGLTTDNLILEVLLDIRELVQNPPIEITGEPISVKL